MNYITVLSDQLRAMAAGFVAALPAMAIALAVIIITLFAARIAARMAGRTVSHSHMRESLKRLVETLARLGVWIVGLLIAASIVLPGFTPAGAIAGLGIGAVAIGFAFQDIFENFLAGVLIMLRNKMRIGDVIECEGVQGRVENITLRESHIRQLSNELTIMPNSMLFKNPVKILTDEDIRRNEVVVGVSYETDLAAAQGVILKAVESVEAINHEKGVIVYAQQFGASSIDFLVQWWARSTPRDLRLTKSEVVMAIKRALDDAGIEMPYPHLTHTFKEPLPLARASQARLSAPPTPTKAASGAPVAQQDRAPDS